MRPEARFFPENARAKPVFLETWCTRFSRFPGHFGKTRVFWCTRCDLSGKSPLTRRFPGASGNVHAKFFEAKRFDHQVNLMHRKTRVFPKYPGFPVRRNSWYARKTWLFRTLSGFSDTPENPASGYFDRNNGQNVFKINFTHKN